MFIILIYEKKELLAILPFLISRKSGFHVLKFIGAPDSDYLDFIIKHGFEKKILDYFYNDFLCKNSNIGIVELDSVNEVSSHSDYLNQSFSNAGFSIELNEKICPYISLPETMDSYLKSLSSGMRYFVKRKKGKLYKDFCVNVGFVQTEEDVENRMNDFILQHQKRWNFLHKPGAFSNKGFENFHHKMGKMLFQEGWLRLYYLELNNHPVASYYLFHYKNSLYYYLSGFEPEYEKYSPGVVLMGQVINDAINDGMDEFDLMRGEGAYKFKWTSKKRVNYSFVLKRRNNSVRLYSFIEDLIKKFAFLIKKKISASTKERIRNILPEKVVEYFDPYFNIYSGEDSVPDAKSFFDNREAALHYNQFKGLFAKETKAFSFIPENSKILDIGCGTGRTTMYFHENGFNVTGVDFSHALVETAKGQNREISYMVGDACALSFKEGQFDVVVFSFNGIDCVYPYQRRAMVLQEIKRVLKPGGLFIFSAHNNCIPRDWSGIIRLFKTPFKRKTNTYITDTGYSWGAVKIYVTTPVKQIEELESMDFEVIKLIPRNILKSVKSYKLIGLIDAWCYYVCRLPFK